MVMFNTKSVKKNPLNEEFIFTETDLTWSRHESLRDGRYQQADVARDEERNMKWSARCVPLTKLEHQTVLHWE